MTGATAKWLMQKAVVVLVLPCLASFGMAQSEPQPPAPPPAQAQLLSPQDLDNLVAPVALYPDPLLAQVFAAATYPLEIVELQQWLQDHRNLGGQQLMDAAKQQNWDPSIQAMVAFPDVVTMLNRDVRWTTDLGNAFLAQQADVMAAVQRMRGRAQSNGRLQTSPQQRVTTQSQDGQTAIDIEPADPQVIYVPSYNPAYIWGPPLYGDYPPLWYPGIGYGFGFYPPCFLGGFFGGFGLGFGWGWGFGWFGHSLFLNAGFFNHYGFGGYGGYGGFGGRGVWAHNPEHRLGVPYANHAVASRFGGAGNARMGGASRSGPAGGWRSFNNARGGNNLNARASGSAGSAGSGNWRSFSPNNERGSSMNRGSASPGAQSRSFAPANRAQNYSGQRYSGPSYSGQRYSGQGSSGQRYSAPHYSSPGSSGGHYSAPRSQGFSSHSSGGSVHSGGGGHSSGGGGHSGGGHSSSGGGGRKR